MNKNGFLLSEEKILWEGRPNRRIFTTGDWFNVPSSVLGLLIILVIRFFVISSFITEVPLQADIIYSLVIISFIYHAIGRFFVKVYVNSKTRYYVTDLRVLAVKNLSKIKVEEEKIKEIRGINKKINNNGKSKVVFGSAPPFYFIQENTYTYSGFFRNTSMGKLPLGFYDLDDSDAEEAYNIVSEIINNS